MRLVIPSVGYADFLAVTLPAWQRVLPDAVITVVTSATDQETEIVALEAGVDVLPSDAWTRDGVFNKAAALDDAFGFVPRHRRAPAPGEVCVSVDADVYPFGDWWLSDSIEPDAIYGCPRYACTPSGVLEAHINGVIPRDALALIQPKRRHDRPIETPVSDEQLAACCLGYVQVFQYRRGLSFGSFPTAGGYDTFFRRKFAHRRALPASCYVLHLGEQSRANWKGRVLPQWPVGQGAEA